MDNFQFLVLAFLFFSVGFIFCFTGKALFKPLLSLFSFSVGIFFSQSLLSGVIENKTTLLILVLIIGIFFAFLISFVYSFGIFFAGFISVLLFLNSYGIALGTEEWNIFIKLILCVIGGLVAIFLQKVVISIICAFLGSYLMVLNIYYVLDFFRFNKSITSFAQYNDYFNKIVLNSNCSIILTAIAILTIVGFLFQWKLLPKK